MARFYFYFLTPDYRSGSLCADHASGKGHGQRSQESLFSSVPAIVLLQNGVLSTGAETDFDGNYNFTEIDPGTYDVEVTLCGLRQTAVTGVKASPVKANKLDIELTAEGVVLDEVVVTEYRVPLVEQDNTTQGGHHQ